MKRVVLILLVCLGIAVIWNWSLIFYGISQGIGQLRIVWNARPIEEVLKDPGFPDSLKQKLHLIKEIKRFAIDSLGLNDSENYQTIYDQKGEELMW
ncbi:MAG: aminopeptidase, partial [Cyclobacteriaceae bacterium]|nr:aminopeptidase [Cyclobacteriaceae bacterium]